MNRKRFVLLVLLASALFATALTWRSRLGSRHLTPAIGAADTLALQAALRYRQAQPRHWRYVMLRQ
jgi:hypothetical protein